MEKCKWSDLDDASSFDLCCQRLRTRETRNFAVSFNTDDAWAAVNLGSQDIEDFLQNEGNAKLRTRWINFWAADQESESIKAVARQYGLSSRLAAQLCAAPPQPAVPVRREERVRTHDHTLKHCASRAASGTSDLESASSFSTTQPNRREQSKPPGFGDVVDNLWHFCSVDRGPDYVCVGFNALFNVPRVEDGHHHRSNKPSGLRIWTSLLLCSDGTVVSVFEQPPPGLLPEHVLSVRFNVLSVFQQISKLQASSPISTLMQVGVRPFSNADTAGITDVESGALLFYYLFDDWRATYSLITQQEHPYRDTLSNIRRDMFESADTDLIKSLDLVGRQLTALKLIYQSYELIIQRVLRHSATADSIRNETSPPALPTQDSTTPGGTFNLPLSARVRFERLLDRVRLYALTEIEECLREKDSLVFMNFNLVSLKESQAVEKLTRTTILLAKATIVFLPVSLMTGYFSIQLTEIDALYSLTTYWVCFLVVILASLLGLVVFDVATSRVEGKTIYKSLTRTAVERVRRGQSKRR